MSNIPCQECGNEFDYNTAKAIINRKGQLVAPAVCFVCIDDLAFTLYEDQYRVTHLRRAEGKESDVERVARISWNLYKTSSNDYERAIVEMECDRARHILMNHPLRTVEVVADAEIVNPYMDLCPKPGQSLGEYLKERGWPEGVLPLPILRKSCYPQATNIIMVQPPVFCKPYVLLVDDATSWYFHIRDIRQGVRSLFLSPVPLPAELFREPTQAHRGIILDFDSMSPAQCLTVDIQNVSVSNHDFRACLLCIVEKGLL